MKDKMVIKLIDSSDDPDALPMKMFLQLDFAAWSIKPEDYPDLSKLNDTEASGHELLLATGESERIDEIGRKWRLWSEDGNLYAVRDDWWSQDPIPAYVVSEGDE